MPSSTAYLKLYASDEELMLSAPGMKGKEQPLEGTLLGIKRSVEECRRLAEITSQLPIGE